MVNFCAGFGILLSVAAVVLIVFGEISQLNSSTIPKHLRILSLTTNGFGAAAASVAGTTGSLPAIYNTANTTSVLGGVHGGLRKTYEWGFWSHCASNGGVGGAVSYCSSREFGAMFEPAAVLYGDVPSAYLATFNSTVPASVFTDDGYLGRFTQAANYLCFVGAILAALAMLVGLAAHRFAFLGGAIFAFVSFICLVVGLAIYTIVFSRVIKAVNDYKINNVALGLDFAYGNGLWLMWAATGAMFLAVVPYLIAVCTGRSKPVKEEKDAGEWY